MNKQTLIWTLIIAIPVGIAALATGYFYRDSGDIPLQHAGDSVEAKGKKASDGTGGNKSSVLASKPETSAVEEPAQPETQVTEAPGVETPKDGTPSFDVVGVEPTGETVVAGRSDSGAIVALVANGKVVGKSIANEAGEWTIILDEPLKPGDYDVGLEVHDQDGSPVSQSEERLAVSVPKNGQEQPLVVLNSPDGPSDILQKPESSSLETVLAEAPAVAKVQEAPAEAAETIVDGSQKPVEPAATPAKAEQAATEEKPVITTGDNSVQATETPVRSSESVAQETSAAETAAVPAGSELTPAVAATETQNAATPAETIEIQSAAATESEEAQKTTGETQAAAVTSENDTGTASGSQAEKTAPTETASVAAMPAPANEPAKVTVEAVESETDKVFVAGTGEPGSSVRVYVGDDYQGEAKVNSSGKWLVEGDKDLPEGNVEVRADLISKDGGKVDARAAVTFEKEKQQQIVLTKVVATGSGGTASGQGAEVQKSLPVVIIRKGDNLWRISRRLYGDGIRYTTIYQANTDQIRNPDLIYPGQVFLTPEGDLNWPENPDEDASNG